MGKVWHNGEWWDETAWHQYACDHEDGLGTRGPGPEFPLKISIKGQGITEPPSQLVRFANRLKEQIGQFRKKAERARR